MNKTLMLIASLLLFQSCNSVSFISRPSSVDMNAKYDTALSFWEYTDENGIYTKWYSSGVVNTQYFINSNGDVDGKYKVYYPDGTLFYEGNYRNGSKIGKWIYYYQNKVLKIEGSYDDYGYKNGEWKYYNENGTLNKIEIYKKGLIIK